MHAKPRVSPCASRWQNKFNGPFRYAAIAGCLKPQVEAAFGAAALLFKVGAASGAIDLVGV